MTGSMFFGLALICFSLSALCYGMCKVLCGNKNEKSTSSSTVDKWINLGDFIKEEKLPPSTLTIVDENGNEWPISEYLAKDKNSKKDEFDIKPNTPYYKVVNKLVKDIEESDHYEDMGRYRAILNVLESDQYKVQKRVVISSKVLEECIDYWPEAFDGVECLIDDNGNGIPDETY